MGKWAMTMGAWIVASFWLPTLQAADDNLYFSGTLVNEPCVLDERDELIKLDFESVVDKDIYLNGRTKGRPVELRLKNCDVEVGKRTVSIAFNGNESSELSGLLELQSPTVQGLLIGLETTGGTALPLNKPHRMGAFTSGDNVLGFNAFLQGKPKALAEHTLGLGTFEASLTFALSYE